MGKKSMQEVRRQLAVASGQRVPKGQDASLLIRVLHLVDREACRTLGDLLSRSGPRQEGAQRGFLGLYRRSPRQTGEQDV